MTKKTTENNIAKNSWKDGGQEEGGSNIITIREASEMWSAKYSKCGITAQTLRNWAKKFGFGQKRNSILARSWWEIDKDKFEVFMENPRKFLEPEKSTK